MRALGVFLVTVAVGWVSASSNDTLEMELESNITVVKLDHGIKFSAHSEFALPDNATLPKDNNGTDSEEGEAHDPAGAILTQRVRRASNDTESSSEQESHNRGNGTEVESDHKEKGDHEKEEGDHKKNHEKRSHGKDDDEEGNDKKGHHKKGHHKKSSSSEEDDKEKGDDQGKNDEKGNDKGGDHNNNNGTETANAESGARSSRPPRPVPNNSTQSLPVPSNKTHIPNV